VSLATLVLGAALEPGGIIAWIIIGLVAGFVADRVIPGKGFGLIGNLVVGIVGAFLGGLIMNLLAPDQTFGFWGSMLVAFLGACIIFLIVGAVWRNRSTY
jgi:uncharacterized membrane protein YeaQ/YmgE (transglycosylase-associated protein family)